MRLFLLTTLTMIAFAANSVLNRVGVASGEISAESFALVRVIAGAAMLLILLWWRGGKRSFRPNVWGVIGLALYLVGFSQAYIQLDAGLGALILFGGVQVTMFAGAVLTREAIPPGRWIGMLVALGGLVWLTGGLAADGAARLAFVMMGLAAVGWGVYSLVGRKSSDALANTAANFLWAVPLTALPLLATGAGSFGASGILYAVISGAVTSALGYALWYAILPKMAATVAAVAQLTVPVIAAVAGAVFLGEGLSWQLAAAAGLILGGVALSVMQKPG